MPRLPLPLCLRVGPDCFLHPLCWALSVFLQLSHPASQNRSLMLMHLEQQEPGQVPILIWWNILGNCWTFLNQSFIKYSFICQSMPVSLYMQTILSRVMCRLIFMIIAGAVVPQARVAVPGGWELALAVSGNINRSASVISVIFHLPHLCKPGSGHKIWVMWTPTDFCGALLAWRGFSKLSSMQCWGLSGHWLLCSVTVLAGVFCGVVQQVMVMLLMVFSTFMGGDKC